MLVRHLAGRGNYFAEFIRKLFHCFSAARKKRDFSHKQEIYFSTAVSKKSEGDAPRGRAKKKNSFNRVLFAVSSSRGERRKKYLE